MSSLESRLIDYISGNLLDGHADGLDTDTPLLELNILDSVEVFSVVHFLQAEFDIAVPVESVVPENFNSVRTICGLIEQLKGANSE